MKFSVVRLEERIAPTIAPFQQARSPSVAVTPAAKARCWSKPSRGVGGHSGAFQEAIVVGSGHPGNKGPVLVMAQQSLGNPCGCGW